MMLWTVEIRTAWNFLRRIDGDPCRPPCFARVGLPNYALMGRKLYRAFFSDSNSRSRGILEDGPRSGRPRWSTPSRGWRGGR